MTSIILSAFAAFSPLLAFSLFPALRGSPPARALADPSPVFGPMRFAGAGVLVERCGIAALVGAVVSVESCTAGALGAADVGAGAIAVPAGALLGGIEGPEGGEGGEGGEGTACILALGGASLAVEPSLCVITRSAFPAAATTAIAPATIG